MSSEVLAALIGALVVGATAIPSILIAYIVAGINNRQVQVEHDKVERELFESFNQRFDRINEKLNFIYYGLTITTGKGAEAIIQDYLNLCSEEFLWYKRGRIGKDIWHVWLNGMKYYLDGPEKTILSVFVREMKSSPDAYYGFFTCPDIAERLAGK